MVDARISDWHDAFSAMYVGSMESGAPDTRLDYCLLPRVCSPRGGKGGGVLDCTRVSRWLLVAIDERHVEVIVGKWEDGEVGLGLER
jgi:hypothetical protein